MNKYKLKSNIIIFSFALIVFGFFIQSIHSQNLRNSICIHIKIDDSINPSTADFIHKSINEAIAQNAQLIIIEDRKSVV
jgi:membrane-bound ClpP family serine protease